MTAVLVLAPKIKSKELRLTSQLGVLARLLWTLPTPSQAHNLSLDKQCCSWGMAWHTFGCDIRIRIRASRRTSWGWRVLFDSEDTDTTTEPVDLSQLQGPPTPFYGSINMTEAVHPQTLLAYEMNGQPLPVAHGAPIRLRLERQLGYKNTKYIKSIELVASFADIGAGKGGYWEDQGYEWYAGI